MKVEIPAAIIEMAQRIAADKFEHCTADPIFMVEKRRLLSGLDTDYTENIGWFNDGERVDAEESAQLEAAYEETGEVPQDYVRTGIAEEWEHHATYITQEGAQAFVDAKGEDFRVYVDSGYRNKEWRDLRAFLLGLAPKKEYAWKCNECGSQEYTMALSEADVHQLGCGRCGSSEWHKEEVT